MIHRPYRRNPALYEVNADTFTDMVLSGLPAEIRAIAEQVREILVPIAGELLSAERAKRRKEAIDAQRATETHRGKTRETMGEPAEMFASVEEAKAALVGMLNELAQLPPPGPGIYKDDVGFSATTNTPLRAFLAAVSGAGDEPPLRDYLRAARLLIVHSKTQLPRPRVMGVIRTLEAEMPQVEKLGERPTRPPPGAFDIVDGKSGKGADDIGTTGWEWSGGPTVLVQIPSSLRYREAENAVPGSSLTRHGETWRLRVPVGGVPALARWLQAQGATKGARKLLAASEHWQGVVAPASPSTPSTPATGPSDGEQEAIPAGPRPRDLKSGHAAPPDRRFGGLSDFDSVKWKWEGGPTVLLALSMIKRGGWQPVSRGLDSDLEKLGRNVYGLSEKVKRGRYYDYYHEYDISDIPFIAKYLRGVYRKAIAGDKLDELYEWWSVLAPKEAPRAAQDDSRNPTKGSVRIPGGRVKWERDDEKNGVRFSFPFDTTRPKMDQMGAAFRQRKLPHRALDYDFLLRTPQIEHMLSIMREEGRFPAAIPAIEALLPEWKAREIAGAPRVTKEQRQYASKWIRRLRHTMDSPNDAEAVLREVDLFAPYMVGIKPGALGADLGPFGRWEIVNDRKKGKDGQTTGTLRLFLGGSGLEGIAADRARPATDELDRTEWYLPFDLTRVEEVVRALDAQASKWPDKKGLYALALSLRAATLIDEAREPCPILDDLSSAHKIDQIQDPEALRLVRETYAKAKPKLAPGMELREYQQIALGFAKAANNRAIIGDAMGLGKTPTAIGVMLANPADMLPALIVAPATVASATWPSEIPMFAPGLRVAKGFAHEGMTAKDAVLKALRRNDWDALIVPWTTLRLVRKELVAAAHSGKIRGVIYDESHKAKNADAAQSKAAKEIAHAVKGGRIFLTGTLIENRPEEAWHQLHMLNPVAYPDFDEFKERFGGKSSKRTVTHIDPVSGAKIKRVYRARDTTNKKEAEKLAGKLADLQVALRCDMVRRLKTDVLADLPPKTRIFEQVDLTPQAQRQYDAAIDALTGWLCSKLRYVVAEEAVERMDKAAQRGRTLSVDQAIEDTLMSRVPQDPNDDSPPAPTADNLNKGAKAMLEPYRLVVFGAIRRLIGYLKAPVVAERIVEHMEDDPAPIVVFVEHKVVMDFLTKALTKAKKRWVKVDGNTKVEQRGPIKEGFQRGDYDVILGSQAMTEGVTLTAADHSFFAEQWWNPAKIEQAEDRIHRGDDRTLAKTGVFIHHLFAPRTVDQDVIDLLETKRDIIGKVLGQESTKVDESALSGGATKFLSGVIRDLEDENGGSILPCVATPDDVEAFLAGDLESPEALDVGFGPEEVRQSRQNPRRRHRNPARASRGAAYQSATLTDGHFDTATVKAATRIAAKARKQGKPLGRGNFGETFGIGGHVVKFPVLTDIHGRTRTPAEARGYLLHEAGVANELAEEGHRVVPVTVFVELPGGTPALVREYGEPLSKVSSADIARLENDLYAVEATGRYGWDIADELLVMRRKDGSLFVADVGWWRARKQAREHNFMDRSDVPDLLVRWAGMVGLPDAVKAALRTDFRYATRRLLKAVASAEKVRKDDVFMDLLVEDAIPEMEERIEKRRAVDLPVPPEAIQALQAAYEVARRKQ